MGASIAVMNTKGGVGKSTLVLALAETLSAEHGKTVLVIDSDAQASVSSMLMSITSLHGLQSGGLTLVDYLVATVLQGGDADWSRYVVGNVSDVDNARSVYLLPSDMQLTLFEREVSKESRHGRMRAVIGALLAHVTKVFDVVIVDCPPGLSVLTESWLREAEFHVSPTKADYVSVCGLEVFRRFKALNPEMGFAESLGVIVNMKDSASPSEAEYHRWLAENPHNRCFEAAIPRMPSLQDAARFRMPERSYLAKYPGPVGSAMRALAAELMSRIEISRATNPRPVRAVVPLLPEANGSEPDVRHAAAPAVAAEASEPAPEPAFAAVEPAALAEAHHGAGAALNTTAG